MPKVAIKPSDDHNIEMLKNNNQSDFCDESDDRCSSPNIAVEQNSTDGNNGEYKETVGNPSTSAISRDNDNKTPQVFYKSNVPIKIEFDNQTDIPQTVQADKIIVTLEEKNETQNIVYSNNALLLDSNNIVIEEKNYTIIEGRIRRGGGSGRITTPSLSNNDTYTGSTTSNEKQGLVATVVTNHSAAVTTSNNTTSSATTTTTTTPANTVVRKMKLLKRRPAESSSAPGRKNKGNLDFWGVSSNSNKKSLTTTSDMTNSAISSTTASSASATSVAGGTSTEFFSPMGLFGIDDNDDDDNGIAAALLHNKTTDNIVDEQVDDVHNKISENATTATANTTSYTGGTWLAGIIINSSTSNDSAAAGLHTQTASTDYFSFFDNIDSEMGLDDDPILKQVALNKVCPISRANNTMMGQSKTAELMASFGSSLSNNSSYKKLSDNDTIDKSNKLSNNNGDCSNSNNNNNFRDSTATAGWCCNSSIILRWYFLLTGVTIQLLNSTGEAVIVESTGDDYCIENAASATSLTNTAAAAAVEIQETSTSTSSSSIFHLKIQVPSSTMRYTLRTILILIVIPMIKLLFLTLLSCILRLLSTVWVVLCWFVRLTVYCFNSSSYITTTSTSNSMRRFFAGRGNDTVNNDTLIVGDRSVLSILGAAPPPNEPEVRSSEPFNIIFIHI